MAVIAYHIVFTTYGFWLPNDERGSGSTVVRAEHLRRFGPATKHLADGEASVAGRGFDRSLRIAAKQSLRFPPVRLSREQAAAVGRGLGEHVAHKKLSATACCVLPDHVHLLLLRDGVTRAESLLLELKANATRATRERGVDVTTGSKVFARGGRTRYVSDAGDYRRRLHYIEENPVKIAFPKQSWSWVDCNAEPEFR